MVTMTHKISTDELIEDLICVAEELDKANITMDDYREHGEYSMGTILNRFEKWNKAKAIAGLEVSERNIPPALLIEELREMYFELGRAPTEDEMDKEGRYSSTTYQRKFGSWLAALRMAEELIPEFDFNPTAHTPAAASIPT